MSKVFACIIADSFEADELISVAKQFAYRIEMLADGIVFDVSGLEKLIGNAKQITEAIKAELREREIFGTVAVHSRLNSALLLARENSRTKNEKPKNNIAKLPLKALEIDKDTLNVFASLGVYEIEDLQQIPENQLVARYGQGFRAVIDVAKETDKRFLTPNLVEKTLVWEYEFDDPVTNYEELVFLFNRGLETLFQSALRCGLSTEQIDVCFGLENNQSKLYEIKTSFPSLERNFWLKLINLRISNESPEAEIISFSMTLHFTVPRTVQHSLYAASKPTAYYAGK